ncbi:hypothetical protein [Burkholderia pseudomallei]|uniref:Uncharacterized protein n=2 Tax=Burkholderia pseudomallei TaxID=28450 RepID=Q3JTI7_BURP1|nr:hypothetical protein [Burkholderia pseudomallei]ABA49175.1 unknown protein, putative [Burkholderia pseudomallei 1710b]AIS45579.1 hypothetical protein DR61_1423 [Burkholderia pseudomallei]EET07491.1 conserved hypothetical protein [Burkholderia pseudomallei 1710a]KGD19867.1 hypothetical protein DR60_4491 [Burkholderia pseudomallei]CAJ2791052.1 Uncharacterised protein [Burkholderia pseudomallei]
MQIQAVAAHTRLALATVAFSNTGKDENHATLNEENAARWLKNGLDHLRSNAAAAHDPVAIDTVNLASLRHRILTLARLLDEAEEEYSRLDAALYAM